jgi:eukaryotic-like serine/threonine-protein kinase
LKHAPEPSLKERTRKWMRRHPRMASTTTISLLATFAMVALGAGLILRNKELALRTNEVARFEAAENLTDFRTELDEARFWLTSRHADADQLTEGEDACKLALAHYDLPKNTNWRDQPAVQNLPSDDREQLETELGELLYMLADSTTLRADFYTPASEKSERFQWAMYLNSVAESCYGKDHTPRALFEQREKLATKLGKANEARELAKFLSTFERKTSKDDYLGAHKFAINGNYKDALRLLQKTTQNDPTNFSAWFVRGNCYSDLIRYGEAIGCFNVCVALRPDFSQCWLTRGLAHLNLKNYEQAIADFDKTIMLQPNSWQAYLNRGLARKNLGKDFFSDAIEDLSKALEITDCPRRVYFERAAIYEMMGRTAEAEQDMAVGLLKTPRDEETWIARGYARRLKDPKTALADFDEALKINPRSFEALQNKSAILSDQIHDDKASLEVIEKAVSLYPDSVLARGGRGILLARQGERAKALADAEASLLLDSDPPTLYQVACIYSVLSMHDKAYQVRALSLLSGALRTGFALEWIDKDSDMDPLRKLPAFVKAVAAARELAGKPSNPPSR